MEALTSGADEAIMLDIHGYVSEGAGDNIFLVKGGELYTPNVQDALEGITRQTVMDLAHRQEIKVYETRITLYDIYTADEIFVTGSGAGIVPVTEVDRRTLSEGKAGPVTKLLGDAYEEEVKKGESAYD